MGGNLSCAKGVDETTEEFTALRKVYEWFETEEKNSDGVYVKIPLKRFQGCARFIKGTLDRGIDTSYRMSSHSQTVQILNNRSTPSTTLFVKRLQYDLEKSHDINVTVLETLDDVQPEQETNVVLICNRNDSGTIEQEVEKCLKGIGRDLYKRIIIIVLHVTRKDTLPKLPSRGELQNNKYFTEIGNVIDMGFLDGEIYPCEMNDSAFKEVTHFCSRHVSVDDVSPVTSDGTHASAEENLNKSIRPTAYIINPSNANAANCFVKALQEKMKKGGFLLSQMQIKDAKKLHPDQILIIVCNNSSRIESDIVECLDQDIGSVHIRLILILVLHVYRKGQEPREYAGKKLENSSCFEKLESLHSVIDMAFNEGDGIYDCKMNETAFIDLKRMYLNQTGLKTEDVIRVKS